jgi:ribosomal protein L29
MHATRYRSDLSINLRGDGRILLDIASSWTGSNPRGVTKFILLHVDHVYIPARSRDAKNREQSQRDTTLRQLDVGRLDRKGERLPEESQKVNTEEDLIATVRQKDKALFGLRTQTNTGPCDRHGLDRPVRKRQIHGSCGYETDGRGGRLRHLGKCREAGIDEAIEFTAAGRGPLREHCDCDERTALGV